jgi:hypothetical protein
MHPRIADAGSRQREGRRTGDRSTPRDEKCAGFRYGWNSRMRAISEKK